MDFKTYSKSKEFIKEIESLGYINPINNNEIVIDNKCALDIRISNAENSATIQTLRCFQPKQGHGTELMKKITEIADKYGINLILNPVPLNVKTKIPKKKLIEFYKKFGFKGNSDWMQRTTSPISEAKKEEFHNLANQQRDLPEKAMLKFQFKMGGGVMNYAVEHIGDIIHRMTEKATFPYAGYNYVKSKVDNALMTLQNPYGFEREFEENIKNNAQYLKIDENQYRKDIYKLLKNYSEEHEKLPVYNQAQELAKEAAVSLGKRNFKKTINCLLQLQKHLTSKEEWTKFAHDNLVDS